MEILFDSSKLEPIFERHSSQAKCTASKCVCLLFFCVCASPQVSRKGKQKAQRATHKPKKLRSGGEKSQQAIEPNFTANKSKRHCKRTHIYAHTDTRTKILISLSQRSQGSFVQVFLDYFWTVARQQSRCDLPS